MRVLLWLPFLAGCGLLQQAGEVVRDLPRKPGVLALVDAVTGGVGGSVLEGLAAVAGILVGTKATHVVGKKAHAVYKARKDRKAVAA